MDQMLTANRLEDGAVLYWKRGAWIERLADGEVFRAKAEADAALAAAQAFVAGNAVVGPYLFDLRSDGVPVKEREIIRSQGPSVREDLGKRAHDSTSPLWGGRKTLSDAKSFPGGGQLPADRPPPGSLRSPTSPQGGGQEEPDVSI
jgi:uncharacterized protein DUF2849